MITQLKQLLGPKCSAIIVNAELTEFVNTPSKQMKFCEAVNHSFDIPLKINSSNLGCPGARRCLSFDNHEVKLTKTISDNNRIPLQFIDRALHNIPRIHSLNHIILGMTEFMEQETQPDLFIVYVKPHAITKIIHALARQSVIPSLPPYSLLSVCGNVFANCYQNKNVSMSFGCPESRRHGGINKEEVVVGIPYAIASKLIQSI
ncbi:MAG: DUF169 domain-containing protein [Bacteroidales bacterium]